MLHAAAIFLILAALDGITLAALHLTKKPVPLLLGMGHGGLAAVGIALLFWSVGIRRTHSPMLVTSLVLVVLAAAGGIYLFRFHGKKKPLPLPVIAVHGVVALSGAIVLLVYLYW